MRAWIIDTFADDLYEGNPAGVIIFEDGFLPTEMMQSLAFNLGLPTTAFVVPGAPQQYQIRWFTPEKELNICGHGTIASAHYLYEVEDVCRTQELCFHTQTGPLYARWAEPYISLNLPCMELLACEPPAELEEALGANILYCGRAIDDIIVLLDSEDTIARLRPDFERMKKINCRGHIVTARSNQARTDFVSRSFFPALGVNEDQVCVSAHCKLGPYWAEQLHRQRLSAVQLSARGGRLELEVAGDRVHVAGTAVVRCVTDMSETGRPLVNI